MRRFVKRPVIVSAIQNTGEWKPIIDWLDELNSRPIRIPFGQTPIITRNDDGTLDIVTREGTMKADVGDWVICGIKGEFYPCKPDIFEQTYEEVNKLNINL